MVEPWTRSRRCSKRCSTRSALTDAGARLVHPRARRRPTPDLLALAVVGPRGRVITVGDDDAAFTIQSMSKPFVLALRSGDAGPRCGARQGGRRAQRRAVQRDQPGGGNRPPGESDGQRRRDRDDGAHSRRRRRRAHRAHRRDDVARSPGHSLWIDESVYASESATGDRNRALAHLLRSLRDRQRLGRRRRRDVLPSVLGAGHGARSRRDGGDARRSAESIRSPAIGSSRSASRATSSRSWRAAACTTSRANGCCGSGFPRRAA